MSGGSAGLPRVRCFSAHGTALAEARTFVRELGLDHRLSEKTIEDLALAVTEACGNAVAHTDSMLVFVSWQTEDTGVEVQVKDDGIFRQRVRGPEIGGDGKGLGIPLMMAMVDEFSISQGTYESPGTLVRLRLRFEQPETREVVRIPEAVGAVAS